MIQSAALIFPSTFLATYGWAVSLGHADKIWPYISDTGDDDDDDDGDDYDDDFFAQGFRLLSFTAHSSSSSAWSWRSWQEKRIHRNSF